MKFIFIFDKYRQIFQNFRHRVSFSEGQPSWHFLMSSILLKFYISSSIFRWWANKILKAISNLLQIAFNFSYSDNNFESLSLWIVFIKISISTKMLSIFSLFYSIRSFIYISSELRVFALKECEHSIYLIIITILSAF